MDISFFFFFLYIFKVKQLSSSLPRKKKKERKKTRWSSFVFIPHSVKLDDAHIKSSPLVSFSFMLNKEKTSFSFLPIFSYRSWSTGQQLSLWRGVASKKRDNMEKWKIKYRRDLHFSSVPLLLCPVLQHNLDKRKGRGRATE